MKPVRTIIVMTLVLGSLFTCGPGFLMAQEKSKESSIPGTLTLGVALEILLAKNPAILRERENLTLARANILSARQRPNPALEISSESYPLFESNPGPFFKNSEAVIRVGQPIETAGKRSKRILVAEQDLTATESLLQDTVRQGKLELRTRYYRVVLAKSEFELARGVLDQFDELIRLNEDRYKQGEVRAWIWHGCRPSGCGFSMIWWVPRLSCGTRYFVSNTLNE